MSRTVTMQKRHFEFIAEAIRHSELNSDQRLTIAKEFVYKLKLTNPLFNAERFVEAATK
jgi:hypothetical protein